MTTIVTRTGKGAPLSWIEADANFTNLNTDKLEVGGPATDVAVTPVGNITSTDVQAAIQELDSTVSALDSSLVAFEDALASNTGSELVGFKQDGTGAVLRTVEDKIKEFISVKDFGAVGDGSTDDTAAIQAAVDNTQPRDKLVFPPCDQYKLLDTITIFDKPGAVFDFGNQLLNASGFSSPRPALHFKKISQTVIDNIFIIGDKINTNVGLLFDATATDISIHWLIGKIYVSNCNTGIVIGEATSQFGDGQFLELYADSCTNGIRFTGENTLALLYGRVAAYANDQIGVHFEQGNGTITSLQVADSGDDLYFGKTSGLHHDTLERWDILGGYSEIGQPGERWINSAPCNDTSPFLEEITISNYRVTPFSNSESDFIRWRLNGDLHLQNVAVTHGQQEPYIYVDSNTAYRAPTVTFSGVIDCNPKTAPQVPMTYRVTHPDHVVEINARVNNGITFWQNDGNTNEGIVKSGIYMHKLRKFEQALLSVGNLLGAWTLRDITSGICKNLVTGRPTLTASDTLERRDVWLDDGLIGFFRNSTSSKTLSTNSSVFSVKPEYTFGAILRPTIESSSEENTTQLGGSTGMRISLYNAGGSALLCLVGTANAYTPVTHPYDPHLVIGRYVSSTYIAVDAINLRTGETYSNKNTTSAPAHTALTWSDGISLRNDVCVRGAPFVYDRALSDIEVSALQQAALLLTDSWK